MAGPITIIAQPGDSHEISKGCFNPGNSFTPTAPALTPNLYVVQDDAKLDDFATNGSTGTWLLNVVASGLPGYSGDIGFAYSWTEPAGFTGEADLYVEITFDGSNYYTHHLAHVECLPPVSVPSLDSHFGISPNAVPAITSANTQAAAKQALWNSQFGTAELFVGYQYLSDANGGPNGGQLFIAVSFAAGGMGANIGSPLQRFDNLTATDAVLQIPLTLDGGGNPNGGGVRDPSIIFYQGYWVCAFPDGPQQETAGIQNVHFYKSLDLMNWAHLVDVPVSVTTMALGLANWVVGDSLGPRLVITDQGNQDHYALTPPAGGIANWIGTWTVTPNTPGTIGGTTSLNAEYFYDTTSGKYYSTDFSGNFWYSSTLTSGWTKAAGYTAAPFVDGEPPVLLSDGTLRVYGPTNHDAYEQAGTSYVDSNNNWRTGDGGNPTAPTWTAQADFIPGGYTGIGQAPHWFNVTRITDQAAVASICNLVLSQCQVGTALAAMQSNVQSSIQELSYVAVGNVQSIVYPGAFIATVSVGLVPQSGWLRVNDQIVSFVQGDVPGLSDTSIQLFDDGPDPPAWAIQVDYGFTPARWALFAVDATPQAYAVGPVFDAANLYQGLYDFFTHAAGDYIIDPSHVHHSYGRVSVTLELTPDNPYVLRAKAGTYDSNGTGIVTGPGNFTWLASVTGIITTGFSGTLSGTFAVPLSPVQPQIQADAAAALTDVIGKVGGIPALDSTDGTKIVGATAELAQVSASQSPYLVQQVDLGSVLVGSTNQLQAEFNFIDSNGVAAAFIVSAIHVCKIGTTTPVESTDAPPGGHGDVLAFTTVSGSITGLYLLNIEPSAFLWGSTGRYVIRVSGTITNLSTTITVASLVIATVQVVVELPVLAGGDGTSLLMSAGSLSVLNSANQFDSLSFAQLMRGLAAILYGRASHDGLVYGAVNNSALKRVTGTLDASSNRNISTILGPVAAGPDPSNANG